MKKYRLFPLVILVLLAFSLTANATLISVSGPQSLTGELPEIISAPADMTDNAAFNLAMQGFDEIQSFVLPRDISVDGGMIQAGTAVDSHMIFLSTGPNDNPTYNSHFNVEWFFEKPILGVMSDFTGSLEVATSDILGAPGTTYPTDPFNARGFDASVGPEGPDDGYIVNGNTITVGMYVSQPGDWIRVVTAAEQVPEPSTVLMLASGLAVLAGFRRKLRK